MQFTIITSLALTAAVQALTITEPKQGATVDRSGTVTLAWTAVSSDPEEFKIAFRKVGDSTNKAVTDISGTVAVKDGKATIKGNSFPAEGKYVIYAVSTDGRGGILAESKALVAKGEASSPSKTKEATKTDTTKTTTETDKQATAALSGTSGTTADKTATAAPAKTTSGTTVTRVSAILMSLGLASAFLAALNH